VLKLREAARQAASDARVTQTIGTAGSPIQYLDQPEFEKYVQAESRVMAAAVRRIGPAQ
jgi:tripartite-type tricarboxylate transporter receptor subunit TctC